MRGPHRLRCILAEQGIKHCSLAEKMKTKCRFVALLIVAMASGCFWVSSPPNFQQDPMKELVVLRDMPQSTGVVVRTTWSTTDQAELAAFAKAIPMETWQGASVFVRSHSTRILFTTVAGEKWEMNLHTPGRLSLYNVTNQGRSGTVSRKGQDIVSMLTTAISKSVGQSVDLSVDYNEDVYEGRIRRIVPESTKKDRP